MALSSDIQSLQNFINANVTQNSMRSIRGDQMNVILVGIMNIILGVMSLTNISKIEYLIKPEDIADGRSTIQLPELVNKEIFLIMTSAFGIIYPIDDINNAGQGSNLSSVCYEFYSSTGTIKTPDWSGNEIDLFIYYKD